MESCREYSELCSVREAKHMAWRAAHRVATSNNCWVYPPELQILPPFSKWINKHVRDLHYAQFPIPEDIVRLSSPPSKIAIAYRKMWAYGAYYRCFEEECVGHRTYDSGVAVDESEITGNDIDVGILTNILMVSFGTLSTVIMKVSWIKNIDQGRRIVKKDSSGF
jgi:hypothetical protein